MLWFKDGRFKKYMHGVWKIPEPIHVGVGVKRDIRAHMCGRGFVRL